MRALAPVIASVFHPSDFSAGSERAFAHALAAALITQSSLTIMGVDPADDTRSGFADFPHVRETLTRWGVLPPDTPREDVVDRVGIKVKKIAVSGLRPIKTAIDYVRESEQDLVVLSTNRDGAPRWIRASAAERIAEETRSMTLFVPDGGRSFVSPDTGETTLRRILIPVATTPDPGPAIARAARVAQAIGEARGQVTLLHVGAEAAAPKLELPADHPWQWQTEFRSGDVIDEIIDAANSLTSDLIVMSTDGKDGILDLFRGSHSERVLRRAPCPVLAIPG